MAPLFAAHWFIDNWPIWLAIAAGIYIFQTPLLMFVSFRIEARATVERIEQRMLPLPESVTDHLRTVETCLVPMGFESRGVFLLPHHVPDVRAYLTLFVNPATMDTALAAAFARDSSESTVEQYVEISTYHRSGHEISTTNATVVGAFKAPSNMLATFLPWITDPVELYEIHRVIVVAKGDAAPAELRLDSQYDGDARAFLAAILSEELEAAASDGYLRLNAAGTHYQPTLTGAYLMTWKQLPPFKHFVARARDRSAMRTLAEVGLA